MASIFSLFGEVFVDNERAKKGIKDVRDEAESTGQKFVKSFGNIAKKSIEVGASIATTAGAIIGSMVAMANKTASTADTFDKASLRTGLEVEELQRLNYAAGQSGVQMTTLENSAKKLNQRIAEVNSGSAKSTEMFTSLGVAVKDTNGQMRSSSDIYNDVLLKLADMGDTAEATALGTDLFGKAFTDMKPLLASGSAGINELKNRADELGIVMSGDVVSAGVQFGDTLSDIKQSAEGMFNTLMSSLIPVIQQVLDIVLENMPKINEFIATLSPILTDLLDAIIPPFLQLCNAILPIIFNLIKQLIPFIQQIITNVLPVFINLLNMILPPLIELISAILPVLLSLIEPLLPLLQPILDLLQPFIDLLMSLLQPLIELLNIILPPIIELLTTLLNAVLPPLQKAFETISKVITTVFKGAFDNIKKYVESVINVFKNIINFIKDVFTANWKNAWEGVKNVFKNIVDTFANIFKAPINFIIDGINLFIKGLNKIKIPDWVPAVGGKGINIALIKKLRVGMDYVPYDEMPAILHKGEGVLTAEENKEYLTNKNRPTESKEYVINNNITIEKLEVRKESDIEEIAEELYYLQKKELAI